MKPLLLVLCFLATACGRREEVEVPRIEKISDSERSCWRIREGWSAGAWNCEATSK